MIYKKQQIEKICDFCKTKYMGKKGQKFCSKKCRLIKEKPRIQKLYEEKKKITDFQIFERDNFKCIYCGKSSIEDNIKLVIDHVYPRDKKGDNKIINLVTSCLHCNSQKSKKIMDLDIIERIWQRNKQLTSKFTEPYNILQRRFNARWKLKTA